MVYRDIMMVGPFIIITFKSAEPHMGVSNTWFSLHNFIMLPLISKETLFKSFLMVYSVAIQH